MTQQGTFDLARRRSAKDIDINGFAARWYDSNTRRYRLAEMQGYAREVGKHIRDGASVLEVAPGPGYLAIELAKLGRFKIIGLDLSKDFLEIACRNASRIGVEVDFRQGNAASIPFPEETFDFVVCTASFKNFKQPLSVLNEIHRVLKSGGTALIVDMDRNASDRQIDEYTNTMGAKGVHKFFMNLIFKQFLRKGAYTKEEFANLVSRIPFGERRIREESIGFQAYLRK